MRKLCAKKYILPAFALLLIAAVSLAIAPMATLSVYADEPASVEAKIVRHELNCKYRYFEYPTAIYAHSGGFMVADGENMYGFDTHGIEDAESVPAVPEGTEKVYAGELGLITLAGGKLTVKGNELSEDVADFTVAGSLLYAAVENSDMLYSLDLSGEAPPALTEVVDFTPVGKIKRISNEGNKVYFTVSAPFLRYYDDVYVYDGKSSKVFVKNSPEVLDLEGTVRLTRDGILKTADSGTLSFDASGAIKISVVGGKVYAITDKGGVFVLSEDFTSRTYILASAHDEEGFFFFNAGISSRPDGIAVADEFNDRVQIISDGGTSILDGEYVRPTAVASNDAGTVFVAHSVNKIAVHTNSEISEIISPDDNAVTDMKADIDGNLFVLHASGKLYFSACDGEYKFDEDSLWYSDVTSMDLSPNNDAAFVLKQSGEMLRLTYDESGIKESESVAFGLEGVDFCVDHDENLYILTASGEIKRYATSDSYLTDNTFSVSGLLSGNKLVMNLTESVSLGLNRGDLLISDTGTHAVKSVSGETLGVKGVYTPTEVTPGISDLSEYDETTEYTSIIYTVSRTCKIFEDVKRTKSTGYEFKEGMRVIIPYDDPSDISEKDCFYVIADNLKDSGGDAVSGYIYYKDIKWGKNEDGTAVAIPEYREPIMTYCYPYAPTADIYKYPTVNCSVKTSVSRGTALKLLPFPYHGDGKIYGYQDNFTAPDTNYWYRVCFAGQDGKIYEGYVKDEHVMLGNTTPEERIIYPRVNAVVISKDKKKTEQFAVLYHKDESTGKIVRNEDDIEIVSVGTEVEVVGKFDSSSKYTLVKFYLDGPGTVTYYVETANLRYDGTNIVTIVATLVIMLTLILAVILIIRFTRGNKKKATK